MTTPEAKLAKLELAITQLARSWRQTKEMVDTVPNLDIIQEQMKGVNEGLDKMGRVFDALIILGEKWKNELS